MEKVLSIVKNSQVKESLNDLLKNHSLTLVGKNVLASILNENTLEVMKFFTNEKNNIFLAVYGESLSRSNIKMSEKPLWILQHKGMGVFHTVDYAPSDYDVVDCNPEYYLLVLKTLNEPDESDESDEEDYDTEPEEFSDDDDYWYMEDSEDSEDEEDDSFFNR
jgi:hypothetical protein